MLSRLGPRVQQVQAFLLESFADGTEGLMLKRLDFGATYQPSKRTESWIKIKRCAPARSEPATEVAYAAESS